MAAGPGFVVEMVNLAETGLADGRRHAAAGARRSRSRRSSARATTRLTDPRILFDAASGRWFASLSDEDTDSVFVAVSPSADPTGGLERQLVRRRRLRRPAAARRRRRRRRARGGHLPSCDERFAPVLGNGALGDQQGGAAVAGAATISLDRLRPEHGLLELRARAVALVHLDRVRRLGRQPAVVASSTCWPSTASRPQPVQMQGGRDARRSAGSHRRPSAPQPPISNGGRRISVATNDDRILDSVWENGKLWFAGNAGCLPRRRLPLRACGRVDRARRPRRGTVDWDTDLSRTGGGVFYPALRPDAAGDLVVVYGESSATLAPRVVGGRADAGRDVHGARRRRAEHGPHTGDRYGDYFGAARDPVEPSVVWVVGETATDGRSSNGWATAVASVQSSPRPAERRPPSVGARRPPSWRRPVAGEGRNDGASCSTFATLDERRDRERRRDGHRKLEEARRLRRRTTPARTMRCGSGAHGVLWRPAKKLRGVFVFCVQLDRRPTAPQSRAELRERDLRR